MTTLLLVIIYLAFVSLGLPDSLLGSAWPAMLLQMEVPVWGAGVLQMTTSLCTILSSLNCSRLVRRFGTGRLTALSTGLTALALLGYSFAPSYVFLLMMAVPLGLGAGAVDAALNNYVAQHCEPRHMNWLHCFWGVGTVVSPVLLSGAMTAGLSWRGGYRMVSLLQALLCGVLFMTLRQWQQGNVAETEKKAKTLSVREVLALPGAKAGMVNFLCYCGAEQTFMLWSATYMVLCRGVDEVRAASLASLFFVGMTIGRGVSGFLTLRFTPRQMVRIGQGLLFVGCVLLLLPVQELLAVGLLIVGLGCAPIYPNIVQDTPRNFGEENSQAVIGVQMAFAYCGSLFLPTVFAWLADFLGYGLMPVFALALLAAMVVLFGIQARIVDQRNSKN